MKFMLVISALFLFSNISVGQQWKPLSQPFCSENDIERFGTSIAVSNTGNCLLVGAPGSNIRGQFSGQMRAYRRENGAWVQRGSSINGSRAEDWFGLKVDMSKDGQVIAGGSFGDDSNGPGAGQVRIYYWDSTDWVIMGEPINGEAADDISGYSFKLSENGRTIAIGAFGNDGNGHRSGQIRVFEWRGRQGAWVQKGENIQGEQEQRLGFFVDMSGDGNVVAGSADFTKNGDTITGGIIFFDWHDGQWLKRTQVPINNDRYLCCEFTISKSGSKVAISDLFNGQDRISYSGVVSVYEHENNHWLQIGITS